MSRRKLPKIWVDGEFLFWLYKNDLDTYELICKRSMEYDKSKLHQPTVISSVCGSSCCKGIAKHEVKMPSEFYCEKCYKQTDL